MAQKKTYEDRLEEAKQFVVDGEIKKAISTLKKAIDMDADRAKEDKVSELIEELENPKKKEEVFVEVILKKNILNSKRIYQIKKNPVKVTLEEKEYLESLGAI